MKVDAERIMKRIATAIRSRLALACMLTLSVPSIALADVYGYVDDKGTLHLATEKLDDHYTLFMKAGDASSPLRVLRAEEAEAAAAPDPELMKTRLFKRLIDHPNIAKYEAMIRAAANRNGLDPQLVKAVVAVESGFDAGAVSDKGAVGLMQVLPATGERYGVHGDRKKSVDAKLADPKLNLDIGTRYLADLRRMFVNRPELALAAYNAGENAVIRFRNAIPPFPETQAYVKLVDQFHAFYSPARTVREVDPANRMRFTIPARRNLPDPNVPLRLPPPPPTDDVSSSTPTTGEGVVPSPSIQ
jgi:soluble lytic murein transglycosylase-like protein